MKFKLKIIILFLNFLNANAQIKHDYNTNSLKKWRSDKKNEISIHWFSMWNNDYLSYGIGYERTIFKHKNRYNSYISWQNSFFVASDYFLKTFPSFSSSTNHALSIVKYNFGYKQILSAGAGLIMNGKKFYLNPTGVITYKYDISKIKTTIGLQYQVSLYNSIPLSQLNFTPIPTSLGGYTKQSFSISENWSGGISIGRYF